jgi:predicted Fe-S protein YdhL (DUF1289 family)
MNRIESNRIESNRILYSNHLQSPKSNMILRQQQRSRTRRRRIRSLFVSSSLSLANLILIISISAVQVQAQVQVQIAVVMLLVHIFPSRITTSLSLPPFLSSSLSSSTSTRINQQQNESNNNNNPNITPPTKSTESSGIQLPPTPCTRICRYNINCYDGNVCIGCFRDTHDISHWSRLSSKEKQFSLEDAADRCHDQQQQDQDQQTESSSSESLLSSSSSESESELHYYEGSISENELRKQAKMWGQYYEDIIEHG